MSAQCEVTGARAAGAPLGFFERYLTLWVSLLAAAPGGRVVTVGATTGYDPPTDLRHVFFRRLSVLGSTMGAKGELFEVLRFVEAGTLRPVLDRVLPLADAPKAHELVASRAQFGKIVLTPSP